MTIRDLASLNALFLKYDNGDKKLSSSEIAKMSQEEVSIWNIKDGQTYEEIAQNNNIQLQQQQINNTSFNIGGNNTGSISQNGPAVQSGRDTKIAQESINETQGDNSSITVINIENVIASADLLNALSAPAKEALARIFTDYPESKEKMGELEANNDWKKLSIDKQATMLENIKYPRAVLSLVSNGEFDNITKNKNGTVSLSSSQHCYNLTLNTNNEDSLRVMDITYSSGRTDGAKGDQMELTNIDSGYLFITGDIEEGTENRHLVVMSNCGLYGELMANHDPNHNVNYRLKTGNRTKNPVSNNIDITYHSGDSIVHTYDIRNKDYKAGDSVKAFFTYTDIYDKDSLVNGKKYNISQNAKLVEYERGGPIKYGRYIESTITGLPKPTKHEPKSWGI